MSTFRTAMLSVCLTLVLVMVVYAGVTHFSVSAASGANPAPAISASSAQTWQSILDRRFAHTVNGLDPAPDISASSAQTWQSILDSRFAHTVNGLDPAPDISASSAQTWQSILDRRFAYTVNGR